MKSKKLFHPVALIATLIFIGFTTIRFSSKTRELQTGIWRGQLIRHDGASIQFNFEVNTLNNKTVLYIINGKERLLTDSILFRNDSVFIQLPFFQSGFEAAILPDGNLNGVFKKDYGRFIQTIPFNATFNQESRFDITHKPTVNATGRWQATFYSRIGKERELVGEFEQHQSFLTGTFLDPTGDYRYLEGVVDGDSIKLSGFDGGHVFLFTGRVVGDSITGGKFYSGSNGVQHWKAINNSRASIADGYDANNINPGAGKLNFSFRDIVSGKKISINDERFKNKVVVIQILGSWCPNCMDETKFLSKYYDEHRSEGVEVIGLAYERTASFEESVKALQPFLKRFAVQYPILTTEVAVTDSLRTEKTLPQLKTFNAFPTTIFVDKKGNIRTVHSGFNGPATGIHYEAYKKEFDDFVKALLKE